MDITDLLEFIKNIPEEKLRNLTGHIYAENIVDEHRQY
jgi:hypothetical protein